MNRFKAIIVDDEANLREALRILVAEYCPQLMVSGCAASAEEARQLLRQDAVDLIMRLPGFDFLTQVQRL